MMYKTLKRHSIFLCKIIIAAGALWFVFQQTNANEIVGAISNVQIGYVVSACSLLLLAQLISALRMQFYCSHAGMELSKNQSVLLYFTGIFFNMFLPGGIGGDGYRAYYLKQEFGYPALTVIRVVLSERASGLLCLFAWVFALGFMIPSVLAYPYAFEVLLVLSLLLLPVYIVCVQFFLKEPLLTSLGALPYSIIIQTLNLLTAGLLLYALGGAGAQYMDYLFVYMVACVVTILPISIGGVGVREFTFLASASYLAIDAELGIALALLYFGINIVVSLVGIASFLRLKSDA